MLLVRGVEVRRALRGRQLVRLPGDDREARFQEVKSLDLESATNELRRGSADILDIIVGCPVCRVNDAPHAWVVITVGRVRGEVSRDLQDRLQRAAELVDDDDGALAVTHAEELRFHVHLKKRRETSPPPSSRIRTAD